MPSPPDLEPTTPRFTHDPIEPFTRLLTPSDLADRLAVHRWTAYEMLQPGGPIPSVKIKKSRRVVLADLMRHLGAELPPYPPDLTDAATRLVTIADTTQRLCISRSQVYCLLGADLPSVSLGRARRVRLSDLALFIDRLRGRT